MRRWWLDPRVKLTVAVALFTLLLDLPHETFHWVGFRASDIPSCVYWMKTVPAGENYLEFSSFWGFVAGPLFNLGFGFLFLWPLLKSQRPPTCLLGLVVSTWLFRLWVWLPEFAVALFGRELSRPGDERHIQKILANSIGAEVAWTVAFVLAVTPVVCCGLLLWKMKRLGGIKDRACRFALGLIGVVIGLAMIDGVGRVIGDISIAGSCP